jgi:hypothetical protein
LKAVKRVEVRKDYARENTVFAEFKPDCKALFRKCFEYDMKFSKLNRLIRDVDEVSVFNA